MLFPIISSVCLNFSGWLILHKFICFIIPSGYFFWCFWLLLFLISTLMAKVSLRKQSSTAHLIFPPKLKSNLSDYHIYSPKVDVEMFSFSNVPSTMLCSRSSNKFSWFFVCVFAKFLMKSEFLSFLNNSPVVTKVLISSSKSAATFFPQKG